MKKLLLNSILLPFVFSFGCYNRQDLEVTEPEWPHYDFGGIVVDSVTKNPVDGCTITLTPRYLWYDVSFDTTTYVTDSDGTFLFDSISPGDYQIKFEKNDYLSSIDRLAMWYEDMLDYRVSLLKTSEAPDIFVSDSSFTLFLRTTGEADRTIVISNRGDAIPLEGNFPWTTYGDWLTLSPIEGTVPPHHAQSVNLHIDASDLNAGWYWASSRIVSNDPDRPHIDVGVTLWVVDVH